VKPNVKRTIQLVLNWILVIFAVLLGILGAVLGFLGTAFFISSITVISGAALLVCLGFSMGLARIAGGKIAPLHPGRFALGVGIGTSLLVIIISYFTVFKPLVSPAEIRTPLVPDYVQYWDLPTGSHIAYRKIPALQPSHKAPVIFLHGGPGGGFVAFEPVANAVSPLTREGYDVYIYDQIGGGLSARLPNIREYSLGRHMTDLDCIRKHIKAGKIILIGESFGAILAVNYMAHYPGKVEKCILVSPGELYHREWENKHRGWPRDRVSQERLQMMKSTLMPHFFRYILLELLVDINPGAGYNLVSHQEADMFYNKIFSFLIDGFVCSPANLPEEIPIYFGFWAYTMMEKDLKVQDTNLDPLLKASNVPVLIIKCECDYIIWEVTYQYKTLFPDSTLLYFKGAGHMPYLEKPDLFSDTVSAFLLDRPLPLPSYTGTQPPEK
jgi:pimeloyl-ACP methyl ester carboxylesterase